MHFQQHSLNVHPQTWDSALILLPFGGMRAHFLLALVLNGRGKPPQYIRIALGAPIGLQKWRHISANIVLLYFMLPELLVRLEVKKRPLPITSECHSLLGKVPSTAEPRPYLKRIRWSLFFSPIAKYEIIK